jgi:hypothetical protein
VSSPRCPTLNICDVDVETNSSLMSPCALAETVSPSCKFDHPEMYVVVGFLDKYPLSRYRGHNDSEGSLGFVVPNQDWPVELGLSFSSKKEEEYRKSILI